MKSIMCPEPNTPIGGNQESQQCKICKSDPTCMNNPLLYSLYCNEGQINECQACQQTPSCSSNLVEQQYWCGACKDDESSPECKRDTCELCKQNSTCLNNPEYYEDACGGGIAVCPAPGPLNSCLCNVPGWQLLEPKCKDWQTTTAPPATGTQCKFTQTCTYPTGKRGYQTCSGLYDENLTCKDSSAIALECTPCTLETPPPSGTNPPAPGKNQPGTNPPGSQNPPRPGSPTSTAVPTRTQTRTLPAKVCGINTSISNGNNLSITFGGNAFRPGNEQVQLWISKTEVGQQITPTIGVEHVFPGQYYYLLDACQTTDQKQCAGSKTIQLPSGSYSVFCQLATQPDQCSGNPVCSFNGGSQACTGWKVCSPSDHRVIQISASSTQTDQNPGQNSNEPGGFNAQDFNPCDMGFSCITPTQ